MAWGTDGDDNLSAGVFDEGDSHSSFLDALNAWRQGTNPAPEKRAPVATTTSSASSTSTGGSRVSASTRSQQQGTHVNDVNIHCNTLGGGSTKQTS